jgi:hypothetical protein
MTKEEIIDTVHKSKCKMLNDINLNPMTKDDVIEHLEKSCCKVLKQLCKKA